MSRTGGEKLLNTSDLEINPATEEGLQEIVTALDDVTISEIKGKVSTANSSTIPLAIDSVFTGTSEDISNYAAVNIAVLTDQDSATDGLSLEWSQDGTNWDEKLAINITANEIFSYEFGIRARYFRVVYTNGGVSQGSFRLQIMFHPLRTRLGARALNENLDPEEFAPTRRSVLAAKKPNGTYENIHSTAGANLKVSVEEIDSSVDKMTLIDDYTTPNKTYIGKAVAGAMTNQAVWQIKCLDETDDYLKIVFADSVSTFTKEWDNRTTYDYGGWEPA